MTTKRRPPKHTRNEWAAAKPLKSEIKAAQKLALRVSVKLWQMMEAKTVNER